MCDAGDDSFGVGYQRYVGWQNDITCMDDRVCVDQCSEVDGKCVRHFEGECFDQELVEVLGQLGAVFAGG